jgi:hypothetical protein
MFYPKITLFCKFFNLHFLMQNFECKTYEYSMRIKSELFMAKRSYLPMRNNFRIKHCLKEYELHIYAFPIYLKYRNSNLRYLVLKTQIK